MLLNKNLKELSSENYSTIIDNNSNIYKLSKFVYLYEKKFLKGNDIEVETNFKKKKMTNFFLKMHL